MKIKNSILFLSLLWAQSIFSKSLVCHYQLDSKSPLESFSISNTDEGAFFIEIDNDLEDEKEGRSLLKKKDVSLVFNSYGLKSLSFKIGHFYKVDIKSEKIFKGKKSSDLNCHNGDDLQKDISKVIAQSSKGFRYQGKFNREIISKLNSEEENFFTTSPGRLPASE